MTPPPPRVSRSLGAAAAAATLTALAEVPLTAGLSTPLPPSLRAGPPDAASCFRPRREEHLSQCWPDDTPDDRELQRRCCGPLSELSGKLKEQVRGVAGTCFNWLRTRERCCLEGAFAPAEGTEVWPAVARCGEEDDDFLHQVRRFYQEGGEIPDLRSPAAAAAVARPSPDALLSLFGHPAHAGWDLDAEFLRCPSSALAELTLATELVAVGMGREWFKETKAAVAQLGFLSSALKAAGRIPECSFRWPGSVLNTGVTRLHALGFLVNPEGTLGFLWRLGFPPLGNSTPGETDCFADSSARGERCLRLLLEERMLLHFSAMLHSEPHAALVLQGGRGAGSLAGAEAVVLARLLHAAEQDGVDTASARRLLGSASSVLRSKVPKSRRNRPKLEAALERLEAAMSANREGKYAEHGKEGQILSLIQKLGGPWRRTFVEIGVGTGLQCNTRFLRQHHGWTGVMLDQMAQNEAIGLHRVLLTAENINEVFDRLGVPEEPDLLSIDVDANDFWLWHALEPRFRPRLVIIEHNGRLSTLDAVNRYSQQSDLNFAMDVGQSVGLVGSSQEALTVLARAKGYRLVGRSVDDVYYAPAELVRQEDEVSLPTDRGDAVKSSVEIEHLRELVATGVFHVTAEEALRGGRDAARVDERWTPMCLAQTFKAICSAGKTFCYSSR